MFIIKNKNSNSIKKGPGAIFKNKKMITGLAVFAILKGLSLLINQTPK